MNKIFFFIGGGGVCKIVKFCHLWNFNIKKMLNFQCSPLHACTIHKDTNYEASFGGWILSLSFDNYL